MTTVNKLATGPIKIFLQELGNHVMLVENKFVRALATLEDVIGGERKLKL
jgi:hypothetical protein